MTISPGHGISAAGNGVREHCAAATLPARAGRDVAGQGRGRRRNLTTSSITAAISDADATELGDHTSAGLATPA